MKLVFLFVLSALTVLPGAAAGTSHGRWEDFAAAYRGAEAAAEFPGSSAIAEREKVPNQEINAVIRGVLAARRGALAAEISAVKAGTQAADPRAALPQFGALYREAEAFILPAVTSEMEVRNARDFFSGFFMPEDNDPAIAAVLQAVTDELAANRTRRELTYRAAALNDGGIMAFTKGGELIIVSGNAVEWGTDERAGIIAHEMAHLEARHYVRDLAAAGVNAMLLEETPAEQKQKMKAAAEYARTEMRHRAEFDADAQALRLMRSAGRSPRGLLDLLLRTAAQEPSSPAGGDHPALQTRIERLRALLD